jgi:catechol 2,3-dioxygenase-like lactoylglutathione lyase family enzyme
LAINPARDIQTGTIDHFSIGVKESTEEIRSILAREGIAVVGTDRSGRPISRTNSGSSDPFDIPFTDAFYMKDQDGTFIQLNESAEVNPATISILRYPKTATVAGIEPVFRPKGLDRVTVSVTNLDKSAGLYRKLCGPEMRRTDGELVFKIGPGTLVVREARRGERLGINHFRVLVDRYDHAEAARRMEALGTELHLEAVSDVPYFTDPDGIVVRLAETVRMTSAPADGAPCGAQYATAFMPRVGAYCRYVDLTLDLKWQLRVPSLGPYGMEPANNGSEGMRRRLSPAAEP